LKVGLGFRNRLRGELGPVGQELDLTHAALEEWRDQQHNIDGGHTDITGDTIEIEGLTNFGGPWRMPVEAVLTPPYTITANQNDYNPRDLDRALVVRITTDASRTFTGLVTDKDQFRYLRLINVGNFNIVLAHNSALSQAPFRFACPTGVDVTIGSAGSVNLWYDRHSANWRVVGFAGDISGVVTSSGGTAPDNAEYLVGALHADLSAERLVGNSTSITANLATPGAATFERAALTGDVTASANSNATTIANDAVTNAKAANMADATIKGRALGAGTGDPTDLSAAQAKAIVAPQLEATVGATFSGTDLAVGKQRIVRVPYGFTPLTWVVFTDATISIVIDIWHDVLANYPPTNADSIVPGGSEPTVSAAVIANGSATTFTALAAGDFVLFNIDSITVGSATWATVQLVGTRT
jgi:hypothetical protein